VKAVLLGATKGIGRALARLLAERGDAVFLLGRDLEDLKKSAQDLGARGGRGGAIAVAHCDLEHPMSFALALEAADKALDGFDTVVVSAGLFGTQEQLEADPGLLARVLDANFRGTILFCEAVRKRLLARGGGTLCVFGSVAGERGRKPVGLYGATKAGLSHYLESLDHKYRSAGLRSVCIKPGFVKTSMTAGLPVPPFAGEPEAVARVALRAIDRGTPVVYAPPVWALIMFVIRSLPRSVMRRVGF
jgi:NAD(P)-dependent dehydrogenase (short-subunit alcohol dehydrogenase family)